MAKKTKESHVPNYVSLKVSDEMYGLIANEADKRHTAMIDIVVLALSEFFKRPDLNYVPRKPQGRKRTKFPVEAT